MAGRAENGKRPACVEVNESFETDINGFPTVRAYQVQLPLDNPFLSCTATGAGQGEFALLMRFVEDDDVFEDDDTYCFNYNYLTETYECSVGGGPTASVSVVLYYLGLPTTITITCSNEPCTVPVCGDGFCSNEVETPLSPEGATGTTCQEDCGKTCGDGICDTEVGEDKSNCLSDCGCLYLNEKLNLGFAVPMTYEIEVYVCCGI